ncbi:MAG: hypothetical protein FJ083_16015 [Cyanobacteria bacterium K_Offshore_surface_m2_239]|nr:hypothetical protein [Cyanobacteria bacterium K_Offshore_surface_m2_239]
MTQIAIHRGVRMIGKMFKRLLPVSALALAASAALDAGGAQAILVFEFLEQGADVRLNIAGSLTGLPVPATTNSNACFGSSVTASPFRTLTGCVTGASRYPTTGPTSIGTSTAFIPLVSYTGNVLFFFPNGGLGIAGYNEGDTIAGSGLLSGQSFSSLGLNSTTPGALLGSWNIGTDTIEARIAVPGPLPLFGVAAAFAHSRRLRARLRAGSAPQA